MCVRNRSATQVSRYLCAGRPVKEEHLRVCASLEWAEFVAAELLPWALAGHELGDDVLEVGSGPGVTTEVLRQRAARLTAAEIDVQLAAALCRRVSGTNVAVVGADATQLPFASGRFSAATSFTMLHHVPSPALQDRLFRELHRVVRPGGIVVGTDSVDTAARRELHAGDVYVPVDPADLGERPKRPGSARSLLTSARSVSGSRPAWHAEAHIDVRKPVGRGGCGGAESQRAQGRGSVGRAGHDAEVRELPDSTRSARDAAAALGCEVAQIVKSLVFRDRRRDRPVLVLASGPERVDEVKLAELLDTPVEQASATWVKERTGFAVGGVPPVGHAEPLLTIIDSNLLTHSTVWAAAGTSRAVFATSPKALHQAIDAQIGSVTS